MHRLIKYFQCHGRYCLQENTFFSFIRFTIIKLAKIKYSSQDLQDMWNIVQNFNWKMLKLKHLKTWEPNRVSTLSAVPAILSVAISAISNSFEILNMLTTIHSFSSKQWMTRRQCVYGLPNWHNTQLICVKRIKNSWMTIWSVRISHLLLFQPRAILTLFMNNSFNDIWELSHVVSCLFRYLYINQCNSYIQLSHPLVQHTCTSTYYNFYNIWINSKNVHMYICVGFIQTYPIFNTYNIISNSMFLS